MRCTHATATALAILGCAVAFSACATATGDVQGGEPRPDTGEQGATQPPPPPACVIDAMTGSGTTWSDLYRDFFGPTGKASCAGNGTCHGDATQQGAKSSGGYVCAGDKVACRASLLSDDTGLIQLPRDQTEPEASGLVQELRRRKPDGSVVGLMPKTPECVFESAAIDRIETWIKNGAPND
jgi:hypothetical protein